MDKKSTQYAGVTIRHKNSIEIQFYLKGVRRRETIRMPPTPANLKYASNQRAAVLLAIAKGTFNYLEHFPDSNEARRLSPTPLSGMTVGMLLNRWLPTIRGTVEIETEADYAEYVRNIWLPKYGETPLAELTLDVVREWVKEQTCSAKRIKNMLTPLRQALRSAVPKLLPADPLAGIKVQRVRGVGGSPEIDPFTPQEVMAALPHLEPEVANMMEFWAWTGVREGELIALKWTDIDEARGVVRIDRASRAGRIKATKTEAGFREVTLLPAALAALDRQKRYTRLLHREIFLNPGHRDAHQGPNGTVYGTLKPSSINRPWTDEKAISRRWRKACKAAGVRYRFPRQMRHTFASWMLGQGTVPVWVSHQLGHTNLLQTLKAYTRFIPTLDGGGERAAAAITQNLKAKPPSSSGEPPSTTKALSAPKSGG